MEPREIALIGKITAGVTHEIRNILAIISESSGLMQDILGAQKEAAFLHQKNFTQALGNIPNQIERGIEITKQLNIFAHSMDESLARIDVNEIMVLVVILLKRFALLKKVELSSEYFEQALPIFMNPIRLILVLAACVDYCLERTTSKNKILLRLEDLGEQAEFQILVTEGPEGVSSGESILSEPPELGDVVNLLNCELHLIKTADRQGIGLILPIKKDSIHSRSS